MLSGETEGQEAAQQSSVAMKGWADASASWALQNRRGWATEGAEASDSSNDDR